MRVSLGIIVMEVWYWMRIVVFVAVGGAGGVDGVVVVLILSYQGI